MHNQTFKLITIYRNQTTIISVKTTFGKSTLDPNNLNKEQRKSTSTIADSQNSSKDQQTRKICMNVAFHIHKSSDQSQQWKTRIPKTNRKIQELDVYRAKRD